MRSISISNKGRVPGIIALLCLCTVGAFGQIASLPPTSTETDLGGINSILGIVQGPSGEPVPHARIKIMTMTRGERATQSDAQGNFAFRGLVSGSYTIIIDKEPGYEPYTQNVDIIQFRGAPAQTMTISIRLTRKAAESMKPVVLDASLANVPKAALENFSKGKELVEEGKAKEAIEEFKLAIEKHPEFTNAYIDIGVQYMRLNMLEEADGAFRTAIKLAPESLPANLNRGIVNVMMKRHGEAVPVLRNAVKIDESSEVAHYFLGQALANLGLFEEAEKELKIALESGNENMKEAHRILAIIYSSQGEKGRAARELETYLRVNPRTPDAEQLKAAIKQLKGQ